MEVTGQTSMEELKNMEQMLSTLPESDRKIVKGYISALRDMQELKTQAREE